MGLFATYLLATNIENEFLRLVTNSAVYSVIMLLIWYAGDRQLQRKGILKRHEEFRRIIVNFRIF